MSKKILSLLISLVLVFTLYIPVYADTDTDTGLVYDETGLLDKEELDELEHEYVAPFISDYGIDLRVDILTSLGDFSSLEEAANVMYDHYQYGSGEKRRGVSISVLVHEDENGLALDDYCVHIGGTDERLHTCFPEALDQLDTVEFDQESWAGSLEEDSQSLFEGLREIIIALSSSVAANGLYETKDGEEPEALAKTLPDFSYVNDFAGLLTDEEKADLEELAKETSEKYECGVYILLVQNHTDYGYSWSIVDTAKGIYKDKNLGYGEEKSGVMLTLGMTGREFATIAYGYGNTAFTDYGKQYLRKKFLDDFADDKWYDGLEDYVETSAWMLKRARKGKPLEMNNDPKVRAAGVGVCILLGLGIGFIVVQVLKSKMKSVATGAYAANYLTDDGVNMLDQYDQYTHTTQTRVYEAPNDSDSGSSGSHGGTTTDSDGFSSDSGNF